MIVVAKETISRFDLKLKVMAVIRAAKISWAGIVKNALAEIFGLLSYV